MIKKISLLVLMVATAYSIDAQVETPAPSPYSKVKQTVGLTDFVVEYSRPSIKGRTIFGGLVPYDKVWRTGANARTKISFNDDITVKTIPKIASMANGKIIFNNFQRAFSS